MPIRVEVFVRINVFDLNGSDIQLHIDQPDTTVSGVSGIVMLLLCYRYYQLGFTKTIGSLYHGRERGKVWLYIMQSTGTETSLESCTHCNVSW
jgi:hypothetical protein